METVIRRSMNAHYEVTIGIPVYRSVQYIEDAFKSALNQTFPNIEFLIVDDCGSDGSMDIIANYKNNHPRGKDIRIIANEMNRGVSYCRNRIIDEAMGKYLYFMDSDDTIEPDTIQLLFDSLTRNHAQIAYGSYEIIDGINHSSPEIYQKEALVLNGQDELAMYAFKNNHVFHVTTCNHLVDMEFLRQSKLEFIDASYWEDLVYTTEMVIKVERAVLLPNITYHYLRRPGSLSHYHSRDVYEKEELEKNISILKYIKGKCVELKGKEYVSYLCYNMEMICFYTSCNIIRNSHHIVPSFAPIEIRDIMRHPMPLLDIVRFRQRKLSNLVFWLLGVSPILVFKPLIWTIGKLKRVL